LNNELERVLNDLICGNVLAFIWNDGG